MVERLDKDNSNQIIAPVVKRIDPENFGISNIDQLENTERFIFRVSHFSSIRGYSKPEDKPYASRLEYEFAQFQRNSSPKTNRMD